MTYGNSELCLQALKAITGLNYTTYQIITKDLSLDLYSALFLKTKVTSTKGNHNVQR